MNLRASLQTPLVAKYLAALAVGFLILTVVLKRPSNSSSGPDLDIVDANRPEPSAAASAPGPEGATAAPLYQQVVPGPEFWAPLAVAAASPVETADRPIPLPGVIRSQDTLTGFAVSETSRRAAVSYTTRRGQESVSRVLVCDLANAAVLSSRTVPGAYAVLALSPDAQRLLLRRGDNSTSQGGPHPLLVWTLADGTVGTQELKVEHGATGQVRDWAAFCAGDKLAVQVTPRALAVYDAATLRSEYHIETAEGSNHGLSRDGKYLAYLDGARRLCVLDVAARRVVAVRAQKDAKNGENSALEFSPSGRRLAWSNGAYKSVFDTATGRPLESLTRTTATGGKPLVFPAEDFFLSGGELYHATEGWVVWRYSRSATPGDFAAQPVGEVCWAVAHESPGEQAALVPLRLPHPAALRAAQAAQARSDFYLLRPGTPVRVDVSGIPDAPKREPVRLALATKLSANGNPVRDDAAVTLFAAVVRGKPEPFRLIGPGGGRSLAGQYRPTSQVVQLVRQNQIVWFHARPNKDHASTTDAIQPNETAEARTRLLELPDYEFFDKVEIPRVVTRLTQAADKSPGLGESQVTPQGITDRR